MRNVQVAVVASIAIKLRCQLFKVLKTGTDLGVEFCGDVNSPAFDPLRAREPTGRILPLPTVTAGAAPGYLVGLKQNSTNTMLLRQVQRGCCAGKAGADDHDIGIDVACDWAIIVGRGTCRCHPVGWRIGAPGARVGSNQWII